MTPWGKATAPRKQPFGKLSAEREIQYASHWSLLCLSQERGHLVLYFPITTILDGNYVRPAFSSIVVKMGVSDRTLIFGNVRK